MSELGTALRAWRDRRRADHVADTRTRRTPGLRREEVAGAAGISVDYLTRLEQGRVAPPSTQVLSALAANSPTRLRATARSASV